MKIRNIYFGKRIPFFCIAVTVLCIAVTLISQLIPSTYEAFRFMYPVQYPWQVISYIFLQGIPQDLMPEGLPYSSMELTIGHLGYNLLLILPFGILVEKIIGTKKMLILFAMTWAADFIAIMIMGVIYTKQGVEFGSSGASGMAFAFMPVGLYALFLLGSRFGYGKLFKQISFYVLLGIAVPTIIISVTPNIAGVTGIPSMVIHLLGLAIGTVFAIVFRKTLQEFFDKEKAAREVVSISSSETV
ncbi:MAG: rhomboid family intramembrane serine protease [Saccharofermentans sp.]|nr:rhomboid family intramembrane serine protease [Saccharofermentans sp.]